MTDPDTLRDSTQIVLPPGTLDDVGCVLESEFVVTIFEEEAATRVIGSPVEIKRVNEYLARNGVSVR